MSDLGLGCGPLGGLYGSMDVPRALEIVERSLEKGIKMFDTSPYYNNSEEVLGKCLLELRDVYPREDYLIATKVGRYGIDLFDYSKAKVHSSVMESLKRLNTTYLDYVYCHDVEFVDMEEVLDEALPELFAMKRAGLIKNVGISGYPLDKLFDIALKCYNRQQPLDAILSYCHLTLQNTKLGEGGYYQKFKDAGVKKVFNASPFSMGLLSDNGPQDWHPSPPELKELARSCVNACINETYSLSQLAILYSFQSGLVWADLTIVGCNSVEQIEEVIACLAVVQNKNFLEKRSEDGQLVENDDYSTLVHKVRTILKPFVDFSWDSPYPGFKRQPL